MTNEIINEVSFATDVVGWINTILETNDTLPFKRARTEMQRRGSRKRSDFTLYDLNDKPILTGELKLPFRPDGRNPYFWPVVEDAANKAFAAGVDFFFTWNVNTLVLWKTLEKGVRLIHRDQEKYDVAEVGCEEDLADPALARRISAFFEDFLLRYAKLTAGEEPLKSRTLDERFIDILDSALQNPAILIRSATAERYRTDSNFRIRLNKWMNQQGMTIKDELMSENIARSSKIAAYVLASRLMFYKALHRRFQPDLRRLRVPEGVETAAALRDRLFKYFLDAQKVTGDYETIFQQNEIDELPFLIDALAPAWRGLVEDLDGFDFTELDYDLLGPIFEQLISPKERHKWGQHYTKPEVCDVINAFVIRDSHDRVLDPACGGGTFLVRAYARKSYLARMEGCEPTHQQLLAEINGVDLSAYAAHISTVNLASRKLADEENYPRVGTRDFFDVQPRTPIVHIPTPEERAARHGTRKHKVANKAIGAVQAVVGNPPYIRQEHLGEEYKKVLVARAASSPVPMRSVPGRSDIHVYFWPHAASFLDKSGRMGLLTSSNWLDTEYGFALQKWMLGNFRILAVLESAVEPWFTGARVATAVTILERDPDHLARCENTVRFVQLRRPIADILSTQESDHARLNQTQEFVDEILASHEHLVTPDYRMRVMKQGDLLTEGVESATQAKPESADSMERWSLDSYRGSKWGLYLRAPDFFFELTDRFGDKLVPLSTVACVNRGVTTGADEFFCVRDVTDEMLRENLPGFRHRFGIKPEDTDRVRLIQAGDGSVHAVEAEFLVPEVHRLAEANSVELRAVDVPRKLLLVSLPLDELKGKHVAAYIRWGQKSPRRFHERSTCHSRNLWYDLSGQQPGAVLWSMSHKYRHIAPWNADRIICNHNLFNVTAISGDQEGLCAVLNSTLVGWTKCFYGRPMGTEGYKTEVVDVKMMLVPDSRRAHSPVITRLSAALTSMRLRPALKLTEELELPDRQALDDAVFELLGVTLDSERRRLREKLYSEVRAFYGSLRHVEVQATRNRVRTARRTKTTPADLALEIWDRFDRSILKSFPDDFLPSSDNMPVETFVLPPHTLEIEVGRDLFTLGPETDTHKSKRGSLEMGSARAGDTVFDLGSSLRAEYLATLVMNGQSGLVRVPLDERVCKDTTNAFRSYWEQMQKHVRHEAESHAGDEKLARQVAAELERICLRGPGRLSRQPSAGLPNADDVDDA